MLKVFFIPLLVAPLLFSQEKLVYESTTDGKTLKTEWKVAVEKGEIEIEYEDTAQETNILLSPKFQFKHFKQTQKKNNRQLEIQYSENALIGSLSNGGPSKKTYHPKFPWIQEFSYGLKPFITSSNKELKFSIISPKDLALHNMIAKKEGFEEITVDGKKYNALKVKVTLQGFKSAFWKGYSWWDNDLMVRYEANSGPHTPVTTTNFISKS